MSRARSSWTPHPRTAQSDLVGPAAPANRNARQPPARRSFASLVALGIQNWH